MASRSHYAFVLDSTRSQADEIIRDGCHIVNAKLCGQNKLLWRQTKDTH
jgi:hypothetical protein